MKKILPKLAILALLGLAVAFLVPDGRHDSTQPGGQSLLGTLTAGISPAKWVTVNGDPTDPTGLDLLDPDPAGPTLGIKPPGFYHQQIIVGKTPCSRVTIPGQVAYQVEGMPEVPFISRSVNVTPGSRVSLKIRTHSSRDYKMDPIEPSLGHVLRQSAPWSQTPTFGDFYAGGGVWPKVTAELGEVFTVGPYAGVNIRVYPIRYDAGKGLVLVTEKLVLDLEVTEPDGTAKSVTLTMGSGRRAFDTVHRRLFGSAPPPPVAKYDAPVDRGRMLIVTTEELAGGLTEFTRWKRQLGIPVTVRTTEEIGSSATAIATAIAAAGAEAEGLTWVLLVGDHVQVPPHTGGYDGSDSDTRYAMLGGDDLYPDVYISRISAKDLTQLQTQLDKFIAYEKTPQTGAAARWYRRAAGIASNEGSPTDYERADLLAVSLLSYGFETVTDIYQGQGASSTAISNAVNDGVSVINYLGHGEGTYWSSVYFSLDQVRNLSNGPAWPWIVDVSCSNGNFAIDECLAEAWLRAGTPDAPQGAVGIISASSEAPWIPPTVMQTEVIDLVTSETTFTLGALYYSGLMKVVDTYTGESVAEQVMDQNIVFGDCSLMVRTMEPGSFGLSGPVDLPRAGGVWTGSVSGPEGSLVTLTTADALLDVAELADGGLISLEYDALDVDVDHLTLTVSGANMRPFIQVLTLDGGAPQVSETETETGGEVPAEVALRGNYPNPFNPATTIAFELPRAMHVRLNVYDIRGHLVRALVDETRDTGRHEILWDGNDTQGGAVASGVYLYRLDTPDGSQTGRMTLSK